MRADDAIERRRRLLSAIKVAWQLNPALGLGELLQLALNESPIKTKSLSAIDDEPLLKALELYIIKMKSIGDRKEKRRGRGIA